MKQQNNSSKSGSSASVTLPNILTLVGLAVFGFFTYLGLSFRSPGNTGFNILWSVLLVVVGAGLIFGAASAKGQKVDVSMWRKVEIALLSVYLLFAVLSAIFVPGFINYFQVSSNSRTIQSRGINDINMLRNVFVKYEGDVTRAISNTRTGLRNTVLGIECEDAVEEIKATNGIANLDDIENYLKDGPKKKLLGRDYEDFKAQYEAMISQWESDIKDWSILRLPSIPSSMEEARDMIISELKDRARTVKLPVIGMPDGRCVITQEEQPIEFDSPRFEFGNALSNPNAVGTPWLGYILLVVVHVLIVLTYFMTPRVNVITSVTQSGSEVDDGGQFL